MVKIIRLGPVSPCSPGWRMTSWATRPGCGLGGCPDPVQTDTLLNEEEQKAAYYRSGFHRGPGPRQAGRGCLKWPFCQELFPSAFLLYQRGRLSEGKAETGERPFRRRHSSIDHSPGGALPPLVQAFWVRADAAFAKPETYDYCEEQRIIYFIRLPNNANLMRLLGPHLNRPAGRAPTSGIQVKIVDLQY